MYENLHLILRERKITINKLSLESGIAPPDLYSALSGKKPLYPGWRKRIAEFLKLSEDEIFIEENEDHE